VIFNQFSTLNGTHGKTMRIWPKDILADVLATWRQTNQICEQTYILQQKVDLPLILISQVQRSGGSLMAQLFDNHSEVFAHPHELKIGFPDKHTWPPIDCRLHPWKNFEFLIESQKFLSKGFGKNMVGTPEGATKARRSRFILPSVIQMNLFVKLCDEHPPTDERGILNAYFTSYFNAWLNYAGWSQDKKYVTGFTPRLMQEPSQRKKFWEAYPDGWHIGIVRKPDEWLHSAEAKSKTNILATNAERIQLWKASANAILHSKRENPDRVIIVLFHALIADTAGVMRYIAEKLSIQYDVKLTTPTFNGDPISSNSSFGTAAPGKIDPEVISRRDQIESGYSHQVDDEAYEIYKLAQEICN